ncbi:Hypothetical_protein [Hexamita inflata]|uniref:Hypothetical_protein n=1 Tax=Hexamita inflata TaxID=28002 RepID=A0AA86URT2_9EUKA|nr:Hypothetical protein HINF_LOCUS53189 [Hexamita inflata]
MFISLTNSNNQVQVHLDPRFLLTSLIQLYIYSYFYSHPFYQIYDLYIQSPRRKRSSGSDVEGRQVWQGKPKASGRTRVAVVCIQIGTSKHNPPANSGQFLVRFCFPL